MHEQMRKWLPPAEKRGLPVMQAKIKIEIYTTRTEGVPKKKNQDIDDDDIFYYSW